MKIIQILCALAITGLCTLAAHAQATDAPLGETQKQFLADYEQVRAALASDALPAAQKAATVIVERADKDTGKKGQQPWTGAATKLSKATDLAAARETFKELSQAAIALVKGKDGYYIAHCPMVEDGQGNWVQTTKRINNPYKGKAMLTCGSIEK